MANLEFGLKSSNKITSKKIFATMFRSAKRVRSKSFKILYMRNQLQTPRLGLAISKKMAKLAVTRNRLKRLTRESFRHHKHTLDGFDVVVVLIRGWRKDQQLDELKVELDKVWQQLQHKK